MNRVLMTLIAGAFAVSLGACNKAEGPAEVQADVAKAQAEATENVADAQADVNQDLMEGQEETALAKAEGQHKIDTGDHLRDRMLDLNTSVHFQEVVAPIVQHELKCASANIAHRLS